MSLANRAALVAALVAPVGCSLINKFDEVVPLANEGGAGTGATGGSGAMGGSAGSTAGMGGTAGAGAVGGASGSGGSSGDGGASGSGGTGGAAGMDSGPPPQEGVVVVGGDGLLDANPNAKVLVVIDPKTGKELSRERMDVQGVAYEPRRDLWYVFERVAGALDPVVLHVRQLDTVTGTWTQAGELGSSDGGIGAVPRPLANDPLFIAVLRDRILYASVSSAGQNGLTVIDTAMVSAVKIHGAQQIAYPPDGAVAMLAHPASGVGGRVTFIQQPMSSCAPLPAADAGAEAGTGTPGPSVCNVQLMSANVTTAPVPTFGTPKVIGQVLQTGGSAAGAPDHQANADIVVFPPLFPTLMPNGHLNKYGTLDHAPLLTPDRGFTVAGPRISSADFDPCFEVALATELITDKAVFAIPTRMMGGTPGTPAKQAVTTAAQRVVWEPYTRTAIRPFDDNQNRELSAFRLGGTDVAPTLTRRVGDWMPPTDVRPRVVVTKRPETPVNCP